jgi:hypothetical protein
MVFTFETTEDSIDHLAAEVLERNENSRFTKNSF